VELEKGVEGLIHISEMSWTKSVYHPSQLLKVDDDIESVVLNIDKDNRRISLGLKQTMPDPWSLIDEKYFVGQRVAGKVRALKDFGAFVEIEEGIEGLVHNADISWTKKIKHPREELKKGQELETIILGIDKENRRITLGLKQTQEDPFYSISRELKEGDVIKAKIVDLPKPGVVVQLNYGIEGFVPLSHLARGGKKAKEKYVIGEELELKVIRVDIEHRRIALSERELLPAEEQAALMEEQRPEREAQPRTEREPRRRERRTREYEQERFHEDEGADKFTIGDHLRDLDEE
jgi:small subunit ribosomal protein S1